MFIPYSHIASIYSDIHIRHVVLEVFLCNVFNCQPADPLSRSAGGPPVAEGFVETVLRLGSILSSADFWQKAAGGDTSREDLVHVI